MEGAIAARTKATREHITLDMAGKWKGQTNPAVQFSPELRTIYRALAKSDMQRQRNMLRKEYPHWSKASIEEHVYPLQLNEFTDTLSREIERRRRAETRRIAGLPEKEPNPNFRYEPLPIHELKKLFSEPGAIKRYK